ncbi:YlaH-like family protein [Mechercharimyces sp. CAU 1602]|uniref:YlaH-like family protein n=1 Tax=Mechercharimyces sp. CAU 1602 TaxID=2973933 RepID=UPI0021632EC6|nr:YlaH-like family protein [Mechercharimyces sp. CAU 1602]MCS1350577.1 YlaH-like family protein [Mechercharimyces sp. CAU 1602]
MAQIETWLQNPWVAYFVILLATMLVYKVAFAIELPILKSVVIYLVLAIVCYFFMLMYLILQAPIIQILLITLFIIAIARWRMRGPKRSSREKPE